MARRMIGVWDGKTDVFGIYWYIYLARLAVQFSSGAHGTLARIYLDRDTGDELRATEIDWILIFACYERVV